MAQKTFPTKTKPFLNKASADSGFTVIELLIATTIFSVVLLVFLTSFIRISELFYKGINISNTQETTRTVVQDIADDIQFSPSDQARIQGPGYFCIGNHRYAYHLGTQVVPGDRANYGVARETLSTCKPLTGSALAQPVDLATYTELLDPGMQVNKLTITPTLGGAEVLNIRVVFYGSDNSVLTSPSGSSPAWKADDAVCSGSDGSNQFCAVSDYSRTILKL